MPADPANRPVRIGIQIQPQHAEWAQIREQAVMADDKGVDIAFTWDHFFPLTGAPEGKTFECWSMLSAFAEATSRVELSALVACNSYRNPDLLAYMAGTIDHISGGRLILAIGSGWFQKDYDEFGYEFGTKGSRLDDLGAALPRIESRLARLNPQPTRDIPIMIGGGGEKKTLRLVARHADIWHGFGDPEVVERKHRILDEWCEVEGRDPAAIERSVSVQGKPADLGPTLHALGTRLFVIAAGGPDYPYEHLDDWLAWRDEVNAG